MAMGWRRRRKGGRWGRNFRLVDDVTQWLRHWYGIKANEQDQLASELQKIYDSEIHVTIRTGGKKILVALGTDFTGPEVKELANSAAEILPRLQKLIHKHAFMSKYDVERLGSTLLKRWPKLPSKTSILVVRFRCGNEFQNSLRVACKLSPSNLPCHYAQIQPQALLFPFVRCL